VSSVCIHTFTCSFVFLSFTAYDQARLVESKCTVLFFDEIDALGQSRGGSLGGQAATTDPSSRRVLAELLIQLSRINANHGRTDTNSVVEQAEDDMSACSSMMDEHFESSENEDPQVRPSDKAGNARIIVVAATNRPEDCDPALLRRFAVRVVVNLPSRRDRTKILKRYLANIHHTLSSTQLDSLSLETEGWTGSDLESLTREAAMAPVRECIRAAALMKRRNARIEQQRGGFSTCQGSSNDRELSRDDSQERILEQFENLRPVSAKDFEDAIAFWAYNQGNADPAASTTDAAELGSCNAETIHYDSSSDEED
jgi:SpoVK/Ycf46/Vps4 family AAA+-type ATPase